MFLLIFDVISLETDMSSKREVRFLFSAVICLGGLAGCAGTQPVIYPGLASADQLAPNPDDKNGHIPFIYTALVQFTGLPISANPDGLKAVRWLGS